MSNAYPAGMRLAAILIFSIALFGAGALLGQDTSAKKFAGTWEARFNGDVFCVLKIQSGDKLSGSMSAVDIGVDKDGNLSSAQAKDERFPILRPSIEDNSLTFEWTDDPQEEPLKFEMKMTGKQEAQLRFVSAPEGIKIKPFTFTRRD
jgi:hypothetical protein